MGCGEISERGGRIVFDAKKTGGALNEGIIFIERDGGYVGPKGGVFVWGLRT
jgi:hypothetical protein